MDVINIGTKENRKDVKVSAALDDKIKERLIVLLHNYAYVFIWSYQDMP